MRSSELSLDAGPGPASLALASALDADTLSDAALLEVVAEVERSMSWAAALRSRLIAAYAARSAVDPLSDQDFREMEWHRDRLAAACQTSSHEAHVRCETALALESRLPAARSALVSGSLPWAQAVVLARESDGLSPSESSAVERQVLADPRAVSVRQVAQATRRAVAEVRPDVHDEVAANAYARRSLVFWGAESGSRVLLADLPVDAAALVAAALEPLAGRTGADDDRTAEQRRADALVALATGERPEPARVAVLVRGRQGSVEGDEVGPGTMRRLTCDADVTEHPVAADGTIEPGSRSPGDALQRQPGAAMRRRLELRDQSCRFPGCPVRARRCHAHHIRHWADGGPTVEDNLLMVCSRHHHAVHEGGWRVSGPAVDIRWQDKHGHTYERPPDAATIRRWTGDPPMLDLPAPDLPAPALPSAKPPEDLPPAVLSPACLSTAVPSPACLPGARESGVDPPMSGRPDRDEPPF